MKDVSDECETVKDLQSKVAETNNSLDDHERKEGDKGLPRLVGCANCMSLVEIYYVRQEEGCPNCGFEDALYSGSGHVTIDDSGSRVRLVSS